MGLSTNHQAKHAEDICIIVPVYKDADRLEMSLFDLCCLSKEFGHLSIVVVDDGSGPEESLRIAKVVARCNNNIKCNLRLVILSSNIGKGGAIYEGWKKSGCAGWLGFVDADGATKSDEVRRMLHFLLESARSESAPAMLIGSRVKMLGRTIHRSAARHLIGRCYATLASLLTGLAVYDSQCGCKFIRSDVYFTVEADLKEKRFAFDMELLIYAHKLGFRIMEFPIDWQDIPGSKVSIFKDSLQMLFSLIRLRAISLKKYDFIAG